MQEVGLVDQLQRVEQRRDDGVELFLPRGAPKALEPALEALALLEVEDHVAGIVGAEVAIDAHDIAVVELGERLRFLDEAIKTPAVVAGAVLRTRRSIDAAVAGGDVAREVLLDGDHARERNLVGEISHTKAAGAQHPLDAIVANQLGSAWQGDEIRHGSP